MYCNKYKKQLKMIKVGMAVQKSTQTRVVGKMSDKVHPTPHFQVNDEELKRKLALRKPT